MIITLRTPLTTGDIKKLKAGTWVKLSGYIYTARDSAHKRLVSTIEEGGKLPFPLEGEAIYYTGPTPAPPGRVIGSCGPTTSYRMDPYAPILYKLGIKATMGKGKRSREVIEACKRYKCIYLITIGGAGALLSTYIKSASLIAYPELGPEAVYKLQIEDFPAVVGIDINGDSVY